MSANKSWIKATDCKVVAFRNLMIKAFISIALLYKIKNN